jgi:hypothetical protein
MGKPSTIRYKAMLAEVDNAITKAIRTGNHVNPYVVGDKRHDRFDRTLKHRLRMIVVFEM